MIVRKLIDMRFRVLALALVAFWPVNASAAEIAIVDSGELPSVAILVDGLSLNLGIRRDRYLRQKRPWL